MLCITSHFENLRRTNAPRCCTVRARVNECHRAVIEYVVKALQPVSTAECPRFQNPYRGLYTALWTVHVCVHLYLSGLISLQPLLIIARC